MLSHLNRHFTGILPALETSPDVFNFGDAKSLEWLWKVKFLFRHEVHHSRQDFGNHYWSFFAVCQHVNGRECHALVELPHRKIAMGNDISFANLDEPTQLQSC